MIVKRFAKSSLFRSYDGLHEKPCRFCKAYTTKAQLEHVGNFIPVTENKEDYPTGQTFIHKVLAYRGVILYPWLANVYERQQIPNCKKETESEPNRQQTQRLNTETYYQVLMDSRDLKNNNNIVQKEGVTFLHKMSTDRNQCLYTIPGIDYVSHSDIMPYKSAEAVPVQHDLFDQFLETDSNSNHELKSTEMLDTWQKTHHQCLEIDKVHKETTSNIRVTAIPFFLGMKQTISTHACDYWWRYSIRIENLSSTPARLRERHWQIVSNGSVKTVRGRGVTGKEPLLTKDHPVFQFSSHISLQSPSGTVWGTFRLEQEDGKQFDAGIPVFALESKL